VAERREVKAWNGSSEREKLKCSVRRTRVNQEIFPVRDGNSRGQLSLVEEDGRKRREMATYVLVWVGGEMEYFLRSLPWAKPPRGRRTVCWRTEMERGLIGPAFEIKVFGGWEDWKGCKLLKPNVAGSRGTETRWRGSRLTKKRGPAGKGKTEKNPLRRLRTVLKHLLQGKPIWGR